MALEIPKYKAVNHVKGHRCPRPTIILGPRDLERCESENVEVAQEAPLCAVRR